MWLNDFEFDVIWTFQYHDPFVEFPFSEIENKPSLAKKQKWLRKRN